MKVRKSGAFVLQVDFHFIKILNLPKINQLLLILIHKVKKIFSNMR